MVPTRRTLDRSYGLFKATSVITQLRTGRIGPATYMKRINHDKSPQCDRCNRAKQTIVHILLACPTLANGRAALQAALFERGVTISALGQMSCTLNRAAAPAIAKFMVQTDAQGHILVVDPATMMKRTPSIQSSETAKVKGAKQEMRPGPILPLDGQWARKQ